MTTTTAPATPTSTWLATCDWLPPLTEAATTAERLLLLIHYGINWDNWVADYRTTYWERVLPERVLGAALRARDLRSWWTLLSRQLDTSPRTPAQRAELEQLLGSDSRAVLTVLREQSDGLLVRTRLVADAVRATKQNAGALR